MTNVFTFNGTASGTATGPTLILVPRWSYLYIQNYSANTLWVTTDGVTTASTGSPPDDQFLIAANSAMLVPNNTRLWTQAASVIPVGTVAGIKPGTPSEPYPYGSSLYGGTTTPGTYLSYVGSAASTTFSVTGTG